MMGLGFLFEKKILARLKRSLKNICINVFCDENKMVFPIYMSNQKFENSMDLLLITDGDKLHYLYIKDLCFTNQRTKTKNTFAQMFTVF